MFLPIFYLVNPADQQLLFYLANLADPAFYLVDPTDLATSFYLANLADPTF